tara:strand:+ start:93 stop:374 length:282 start_codon:yes stop_codon:yes gene_type:complete
MSAWNREQTNYFPIFLIKKETIMVDIIGMTIILLMGMFYGWAARDLYSEHQDSKVEDESLLREDFIATMELREQTLQDKYEKGSHLSDVEAYS